MLKRLLQLLALSALALSASLALAQRTPILVYTALETDQLKAYKDTFETTVKDVEIRWVRDSTGVITAKLLAEKANPQADVVLGLAATSLLVLEQEGMLTPYAPKGVETLNPRFVDTKKPPMWVGMDVWGATICFNTVEAKKRNLPKPESWKDLLKPIYKGQITMPHPASSGTGFLDVTAWLQLYGEAEGWKYMDALHENIAQYVHSGSKPCRQAGAGEFVMGISFEYRGERDQGLRRADRPHLPEGRRGLGHGSLRDHEGEQEAGSGAQADGLGRDPRSERALRQELRDRRHARRRQAAAQRAGELRADAGEERLRLGGEEPRPHPRRMGKAL